MSAFSNAGGLRLGVLLSGRGSNFQAIHQTLLSGSLTGATLAMVVSNKSKAEGLAYAASQGIPTASVRPSQYPSLEAYDAAVLQHLQEAGVELLILAGYTKILSSVLLNAYAGRILNIHPSLLPAYGGVGMVGHKVHEAVIQAKEPFSGCTVHLVTAEVDGGPILGQARVPVSVEDTADSLAAKVLEQEHRLYSQVIQRFILGEYREHNAGGPVILCPDTSINS